MSTRPRPRAAVGARTPRGIPRGVGRFRLRPKAGSARGQALVELALVVPVLCLLVMAGLDLGRVFYSQITLTDSARAGAFEAAQDPTSWSAGNPCNATTNRVMCAATKESSGSFVTVAPSDVSLSCSPGCGSGANPANRVTVGVQGHFTLITPIVWVFTGGPDVLLTASATADIINIPPPPAAPTPTPTPTATPTPTPTPTSTAGPTPTPTATPTPTPTCALPVADFSTHQQNKNKPVDFTSLSTPTTGTCAITYWRWDYGDSNTDAGNLPSTSHTYTVSGDYNVTLTVTNPGGVATRVVTIHADAK